MHKEALRELHITNKTNNQYMKSVQILLVSAFILLSINTISAQYGYGGYGNNGYGNNGYGNNGYGRNRGMSQMTAPMHDSKPKEIPVEETVAKIVDRLNTTLTLDELQAIAIANIMTESLRDQGVMLKQDTNQLDKEKDIKALSEITEAKILLLLNNYQKEKYAIFKEDMKNPRKSKSDKKSKKKAEEKPEVKVEETSEIKTQ